MTDTSDVACALACMLVSNPQNTERPADWKRRVNDLIRALRDERDNTQIRAGAASTGMREWRERALLAEQALEKNRK
jgi:hypothetical protein